MNYNIRCGIKLSHWEEGQVFSSKKIIETIEQAKKEADDMLEKIIKSQFKKIECGELLIIDENYEANYESDKSKMLIGRLDGKIKDENNEGEFYIDIVKPKFEDD